jgi:mannose-6-phosphate isomerase-like protein (cupin superfamily)
MTRTDGQLQPEAPRADMPASPRRRIVIYQADQAETFASAEMTWGPDLPPEITDGLDLTPLSAGSKIKVLFREGRPDGYSLVWAWFGANYPLARHAHSTDCLYYVAAGQVSLGRHSIRAGSGFFVPAHTPYRFKVGPEGVQILEFRAATSFETRHCELSADRWRAIVEIAQGQQDVWNNERPE